MSDPERSHQGLRTSVPSSDVDDVETRIGALSVVDGAVDVETSALDTITENRATAAGEVITAPGDPAWPLLPHTVEMQPASSSSFSTFRDFPAGTFGNHNTSYTLTAGEPFDRSPANRGHESARGEGMLLPDSETLPILPAVSHDNEMDSRQIPTFTPQTPTHTPAVFSPDDQWTPIRVGPIPPLDLNVANDDLSGIGDNPYAIFEPETDFEMFPEGQGGPGQYEYRLGEPNWVFRNRPTRRRVRFTLPNPDNLPVFELVVGVPYDFGRDSVRMVVDLPPRDSYSREGFSPVLRYEVRQITSYGNDYQDPAIINGRRARKYVNQLPRLDLTDMPDLRDQPCNICREPFEFAMDGGISNGEDPEFPIRLPCSHIFGAKCLRGWLLSNIDGSGPQVTQCPLCRTELALSQVDDSFPLPPGVSREADGVSPEEHDRASEMRRNLDNERFKIDGANNQPSRDADLASELEISKAAIEAPSHGGSQALFLALQSRGAFQPPQINEVFLRNSKHTDEELYTTLVDSGAHWTTRWGWMKAGRPLFGSRLREEERKDYIRYHIRTNSQCWLFGASDDVLRSLPTFTTIAIVSSSPTSFFKEVIAMSAHADPALERFLRAASARGIVVTAPDPPPKQTLDPAAEPFSSKSQSVLGSPIHTNLDETSVGVSNGGNPGKHVAEGDSPTPMPKSESKQADVIAPQENKADPKDQEHQLTSGEKGHILIELYNGPLNSVSEERAEVESYFPWNVAVDDLRFGSALFPVAAIKIRLRYVPSQSLIAKSTSPIDAVDEECYKVNVQEAIEVEKDMGIVDGLAKRFKELEGEKQKLEDEIEFLKMRLEVTEQAVLERWGPVLPPAHRDNI